MVTDAHTELNSRDFSAIGSVAKTAGVKECNARSSQEVSYVSKIKLSPDAKYLYVSNRGDSSLAEF